MHRGEHVDRLGSEPPGQEPAARPGAGWPRRHIVVAMTFAACVISYTDRVNISVAIVAMKDHFGWTETEKGFVLSSFFIGYMMFMFPGGLLSTRFGGRIVLGVSVLAWSVLTFLTPRAALTSFATLVAARIGMGLGEAAMFPGAFELFGHWIPVHERARASARMLSGIPIGTIAGLSGGGWLVAQYGWPAAFYGFGLVGLLWVLAWFPTVSNRPRSDPRVGEEERALLPPVAISSEFRAATFRRELLRAPVAAIVGAHFAITWSLYVLLSWLPSYFNNVQKLGIARAGLYSALPWIAMFASSQIAASVSDRMIKTGAPVGRTRKLMQCGSLLGTAALLLSLQHAHSALMAEALLCVATAALGVSFAGFAPAMLDVAPRNSAVVYGFSNMVATLPGIIGVAVTGWLLDVTGTYAAAFALTAAVSVLGAIVFGLLFRPEPVTV